MFNHLLDFGVMGGSCFLGCDVIEIGHLAGGVDDGGVDGKIMSKNNKFLCFNIYSP